MRGRELPERQLGRVAQPWASVRWAPPFRRRACVGSTCWSAPAEVEIIAAASRGAAPSRRCRSAIRFARQGHAPRLIRHVRLEGGTSPDRRQGPRLAAVERSQVGPRISGPGVTRPHPLVAPRCREAGQVPRSDDSERHGDLA